MAQMRELAAGQSTHLPEVVLRARLTGSTGTVALTALDTRGDDVTFKVINSITVLAHPAAGSVRLVATPLSSDRFAPGTRIGLDVRVESSQVEAQQVLTQSVDVGALGHYELARLEHTPGDGWTVIAPAGRPASRENSEAGAHAEHGPRPNPGRVSSTADERQYPWISAGRYAFRGSRGGSPSTEATGVPWALILDASLSMRAVYLPDQLTALVEVVAGVLTEWTGRMPTAAMATGAAHHVVVDGAAERPATLVASVFEGRQPPSWSILTPAVSDAVRRGAHIVAIVTDGAPADTRDLGAFAASRSDTQVLVVAAGRSGYSLPSERVPGVEELGALADLGAAPNVTVVAVREAAATDEQRRVELATALTRVA